MKIVCFGDSNTYGYDPASWLGSRYPSQHRWVDILAGKRNCVTANEGENGRQIPRREWDIRAAQQMLAQHTPFDLLVILLGTNDLLLGSPAREAARRMEAFLEQITLERSKILLIGPPPMERGEWVPDQKLIDASKELNREYKALCKRLGVRFADAGEWNIPLTFDGVHFTEEGHRAFAEGLTHYLDKGD